MWHFILYTVCTEHKYTFLTLILWPTSFGFMCRRRCKNLRGLFPVGDEIWSENEMENLGRSSMITDQWTLTSSCSDWLFHYRFMLQPTLEQQTLWQKQQRTDQKKHFTDQWFTQFSQLKIKINDLFLTPPLQSVFILRTQKTVHWPVPSSSSSSSPSPSAAEVGPWWEPLDYTVRHMTRPSINQLICPCACHKRTASTCADDPGFLGSSSVH